jgi:hypothetical protein
MDELTLLQAMRLKGRVQPAALAAALDTNVVDLDETLKALTEAGLLIEGKTVRMSPEGRDRLAELLSEERRGIDSQSFARTYDEFRTVNRDFKSLVSEWQLREGEPNCHDDAEYDAAVLARLDGVHQGVTAVLAAATEPLPRLGAYTARLSAALDKIHAGDVSWFTRPIVDSYHTVWFELHEELIGAAGLTREQEAGAGHAE